MRARRRHASRSDYLSDALALLDGWSRDGHEINRILRLDDAQHAALTERVKVIADALQLRPTIRRLDGRTLKSKVIRCERSAIIIAVLEPRFRSEVLRLRELRVVALIAEEAAVINDLVNRPAVE